MIQKSRAILLAKKDIRESSCIVHFFTESFGKIKGLIKGVRGPKAVFGVYIHEFADYDIVFYEKKRKDIYTISNCDLLKNFEELNQNLDKRLWAYYIVELVDKLTSLEDKNSKTYWLLLETLRLLNKERFTDKVVMTFQLKFLMLSGIMPQIEFCVNCNNALTGNSRFSVRSGGLLCEKCHAADIQAFPVLKGAIYSMRLIIRTPLADFSRISIGEKVRKEISTIMERFIDYQLGEHLKSASFIKAAI